MMTHADVRAARKLAELVLDSELNGPRLTKAATWRAWITLLKAEQAAERERVRQEVEWLLEDIFR